MSKRNSQRKSAISFIPSYSTTILELLLGQANNCGLVAVNDGIREISLFGTFALTFIHGSTDYE